MSVSKYKFVSPGVFIKEIDRSRLPAPTPVRGPVIIGRTERGPSMRPVTVNSFSDYIEMFGDTVPGGQGGDVWRDGNYTSPMYATYAAEAWLRNGQSATVVRLLGAEHTDKQANGEAGWGGYTRVSTGAGAYGLFLLDSGSQEAADVQGYNPGHSGSLAAVWYFPANTDYLVLSGTIRGGEQAIEASAAQSRELTGNCVFLEPQSGTRDTYTVNMVSSETVGDKFTFNFDPDSDLFIRKVFNTNPIMTNSTLIPGQAGTTGSLKKYWLGHSFEGAIASTGDGAVVPTSSAGTIGIILPLGNAAGGITTDWSNFQVNSSTAKSGWVISQDLRGSSTVVQTDAGTYRGVDGFDPKSTASIEKLFQFHSLDLGEWANRNIKISIANISASPNADVDAYGSFDVLIRRASDSDNRVEILEQYNNCNLNPVSPNYIARRIGDTYTQWDDTQRRFRIYGDYVNISKFIRVEMNTDATDPRLLPFGFWGPFRPKAFTIHQTAAGADGVSGFTAVYTENSGAIGGVATFAATASVGGRATGSAHATTFEPISIRTGIQIATSSFIYPNIRMRLSSSDSTLPNERAAYFGYDSNRENTRRFDRSNIDILRMLPANLTPDTATQGDSIEISTAFTLDDLVITERNSDGERGKATYTSGSRELGNSATALTGTYQCILEDHGFNKFTLPMFGGSDGWNITEMDPVANRILATGNEKTNYAYNTVRRAIDACSDPEQIDFNLMVAPGVTTPGLTDLMVNVCEERGDALAIIDLPDVYLGPPEATSAGQYASFANRVGKLNSVVTAFKNRKKNSSYGCTYYPWVQVRDSLNNASVWVPPSVVALGTFAHSDRVGELWFAPAGFNRGGLSKGSSGLTVTNVSERVTSEQRDKLYEANINPLASFPNEGIVVFGQKTLDATTSAMSRINVRRLLIFLKKEISRLANEVLFDQNIEATWSRFRGLVVPLLDQVKINFGLTDYKMVLDETTTTPDLIDRNIMYAKIFLKPARAIEFIALDFIITRTGASFDD